MGELILMYLCQPALGVASFFETQCKHMAEFGVLEIPDLNQLI